MFIESHQIAAGDRIILAHAPADVLEVGYFCGCYQVDIERDSGSRGVFHLAPHAMVYRCDPARDARNTQV